MHATQDRIPTSTLRIVDVGQVLDELAELGPEEHEELLRWIWRDDPCPPGCAGCRVSEDRSTPAPPQRPGARPTPLEVTGLDEPMTPARRDLVCRLGWTTGCIGKAAGELPDDRLEDVIRTLEHAAEILADEAGIRLPPWRTGAD